MQAISTAIAVAVASAGLAVDLGRGEIRRAAPLHRADGGEGPAGEAEMPRMPRIDAMLAQRAAAPPSRPAPGRPEPARGRPAAGPPAPFRAQAPPRAIRPAAFAGPPGADREGA